MNIASDSIVTVAQRHVELYRRRLFSDNPTIDQDLCRDEIDVWMSIEDKKGVDLTREEEDHVQDAYYSGEFDPIGLGWE